MIGTKFVDYDTNKRMSLYESIFCRRIVGIAWVQCSCCGVDGREVLIATNDSLIRRYSSIDEGDASDFSTTKNTPPRSPAPTLILPTISSQPPPFLATLNKQTLPSPLFFQFQNETKSLYPAQEPLLPFFTHKQSLRANQGVFGGEQKEGRGRGRGWGWW